MRPAVSTSRFTLSCILACGALSFAVPAHAEAPTCQVSGSLDSGSCTVKAGSPGSGPGGSTAPASNRSQRMCKYNGEEIPCSKDGRSWNAASGCYLSGPIAIFDSANTGGDGYSFYECKVPGGGVSILRLPNTAPVVVDPEILARQAIEQMNLQAISIGIVPEPGPASMGLVGLPVWMWVDQPGPTTWGPLTTSATAGATTVTATARVAAIEWNMGDGTIITCTGLGTPYTDPAGDTPSPDCGHTYTRTSAAQAGQAYTVTATSNWTIDWAGGGASGTIPLSVAIATPLRIGEVQVLVKQ